MIDLASLLVGDELEIVISCISIDNYMFSGEHPAGAIYIPDEASESAGRSIRILYRTTKATWYSIYVTYKTFKWLRDHAQYYHETSVLWNAYPLLNLYTGELSIAEFIDPSNRRTTVNEMLRQSEWNISEAHRKGMLQYDRFERSYRRE